MKLPGPLLEGRLLRRYQRFLADVELADGSVVTAHTPNTGSMRQCAVPGHRVLLSRSDNIKRKLPHTLELIEVNGRWVDTHTQRSNRVVEEGLRGGAIAELAPDEIVPEYRYGASRIDFLLRAETEKTLVEVKNVTLICGAATACFPDAPTLRGQKHLRELIRAKDEGYRAVVFFLVQRAEARDFAPADAIDPAYGRLLRTAVSAGVEALAYGTLVSPSESLIGARLPVTLSDVNLG